MTKQRHIVETADGSSTLFDPESGDHYHSMHGAENESKHVFVKMGLEAFCTQKPTKDLHILEVGFGTGLNAILSYCWLKEHPNLTVHYHTLEPKPLEVSLVKNLKFGMLKEAGVKEAFQSMHDARWAEPIYLNAQFEFQKFQETLQAFKAPLKYDLVYYDAFAPRHQSEMWELKIFEKLYKLMTKGGILVSYCAQGQFKRNLLQGGFSVEKLPGPPGKREMIRASKVNE